MTFPKNFIWGSASSAHQIEGDVEGRGPSIWDKFSYDGNTHQNQNANISCDHLNRFKDDIALMKKIGINSYRFSISWPRIIPEGKGRVSEKGLSFYDKLVDELLKNDIVPFVTLFHWDLPLKLQEIGGWTTRDSSKYFADYVKVITSKLSDRVENWITLNEPNVFVRHGYEEGFHAPGLKLSFKERLNIIHNLFLAHGKAVKVIRDNSVLDPKIGIAPGIYSPIPVNEKPETISSVREFAFYLNAKNLWSNTWWLDTILKGEYPKEYKKYFPEDMPQILDGDMEIISSQIDFIGANLYFGELRDEKKELISFSDEHEKTNYGWYVTPEIMYWSMKFLYERYKMPIYVTENGMSSKDVLKDGQVEDQERIKFMNSYLLNLKKAIDEGIDVRGYFYWSIMDNFEWEKGYDQRFGLIYIDYETQKRYLKQSAIHYQKIIETNGEILKR